MLGVGKKELVKMGFIKKFTKNVRHAWVKNYFIFKDLFGVLQMTIIEKNFHQNGDGIKSFEMNYHMI